MKSKKILLFFCIILLICLAACTTKMVTVSFYADGALFREYRVEKGGSLDELPAVPEKEGYKGIWSSTDLDKIDSDRKIEAVYTRSTYKVTFRVDGEEIATRTAEIGKIITDIPQVPAKEGYIGEWNVTQESFLTLTTDTIVNAVYRKQAIAITFYNNVFSYDVALVKVGDPVAANTYYVLKEGYSLTTDKTFQEGTVYYTRSRERITVLYAENGVISGEIPTPPAQQGYSVKWMKINTTATGDIFTEADFTNVTSAFSVVAYPYLTVTVVDKFVGRNSSYSYEIGERVTSLRPLVSSLADYEFYGWYTDPDYKNSLKFPYVFTQNTTVYAKWIGTKATEGVLIENGNVVGYNGSATEVFIPMKYQSGESTAYVTGIAASAFKNKTITSISIPATVTSIGDSAFYGCNSLTKVNFPDGNYVSSYGNSSFRLCRALASFDFSDKTSVIGGYAFYGCAALTTVTGLRDSVLSALEKYAFSGCVSLNSVALPRTLKTIGERAFAGDTEAAVSFEDETAIERVGDFAFENCKKFLGFRSDKLREMGESIFSGCSSLTSATLFGTYKLPVLFGTTEPQGEEADNFYAVAMGGTYYVPKTLYSVLVVSPSEGVLETKSFYDCYSVKNVTFSGTVTKIASDAFLLEHYPVEADRESFNASPFSIELPSTLTELSSNAFHTRNDLVTIELPASLETIGEKAFYGLSLLRSVSVGEGRSNLSTVGSDVFTGTKWYNNYPGLVTLGRVVFGISEDYCSKATYYEIPEEAFRSYSVIAPYAFSGNRILQKIVLSESITQIGEKAFYGCSQLKTFVFQANVTTTARDLGATVLDGCNNLLNLTICEDIDLDALFTGKVPDSLIALHVNRSSLFSIVAENEEGFSASCLKNTKVTTLYLGEGFTKIEEDAFKQIPSLITVNLGKDMTTLGARCFAGCENLEKINAEEGSLTVIEESCFDNCSKLETFMFTEPLEYIGKNAFKGTDLTRFAAPSSLKTIEEAAFDGCVNLNNVTLNEGLETIGNYAFRNCDLSTLSFPSTIIFVKEKNYLCSTEHAVTVTEAKIIEEYCDCNLFGTILAASAPFINVCSEKQTSEVGDAGIVIDSCDCNVFGTLLKQGGELTNLARHSSDAHLDPTLAVSFDLLADLFVAYKDSRSEEDKDKAYELFFKQAKALFNKSNSPFTDVEYEFSSGGTIDLMGEEDIAFKDYYIKVSDPTAANLASYYELSGKQYVLTADKEINDEKTYYKKVGHSDYLSLVSRLFGYNDTTSFLLYSQALATEYEANSAGASVNTLEARCIYDGAVFTANGTFILPFVFKNALSDTTFAFVLATEGKMYVWFSDINAACKVANMDNDDLGEGHSGVDVCGRCLLFEELSLPDLTNHADQGSLTEEKAELFDQLYRAYDRLVARYEEEIKKCSAHTFTGASLTKIEYCDCDRLTMLLQSLGEAMELSDSDPAFISSTTVSKFDDLGELFKEYQNDKNEVILTALFAKAKEIFLSSGDVSIQNLTYSIKSGAVLQFNDFIAVDSPAKENLKNYYELSDGKYIPTTDKEVDTKKTYYQDRVYGNEARTKYVLVTDPKKEDIEGYYEYYRGEYNKTADDNVKENKTYYKIVSDDRLLAVARLFGYASESDFKSNVQDISLSLAAYTRSMELSDLLQRAYICGAVYTDNGSFIFPYAIKSDVAETVLVYFVFGSDGVVSVWISDIDAAYRVGDGSSVSKIYGRCCLFDEVTVENGGNKILSSSDETYAEFYTKAKSLFDGHNQGVSVDASDDYSTGCIVEWNEDYVLGGSQRSASDIKKAVSRLFGVDNEKDFVRLINGVSIAMLRNVPGASVETTKKRLCFDGAVLSSYRYYEGTTSIEKSAFLLPFVIKESEVGGMTVLICFFIEEGRVTAWINNVEFALSIANIEDFDYKESNMPHNKVYGRCSLFDTPTVVFYGEEMLAGNNNFRSLVTNVGVSFKKLFGDDFFAHLTTFTTVTVTGGEIVEEEFKGLTSVRTATLQNGVTAIGDRAFMDCTSLERIVIPSSVTYIGESAFENCETMTNVQINTDNGQLRRVGKAAFKNCSSLQYVIFPETIVSGDWTEMFYNCGNLTGTNLPASITDIGEKAFYGCKKMNNLRLHDNVASIGDFAFKDCYVMELDNVDFGSLKYIGESAFENDRKLNSIRAEYAETIGRNAFKGCSSITEITIGENAVSYYADAETLAKVSIINVTILAASIRCSDSYRNEVQEGTVIDSCDCNVFGSVLSKEGSTNDINAHASSTIDGAIISLFDELSTAYTSARNGEDDWENFIAKAKNVFASAPSLTTKNLTLLMQAGALIDLEAVYSPVASLSRQELFRYFEKSGGKYVLTKDTAIDPEKTYYSESFGFSPKDNYTVFADPTDVGLYGCFEKNNLSYVKTEDGKVDVNKTYYRTLRHDDYINILARIFGYDDVEKFVLYAQRIANEYKLNTAEASATDVSSRLKYDGAIYTEGNIFILPFAFMCPGKETIRVLVFVDSDGKMSVWISDVEEAMNAVRYGTGDNGDTDVYSLYGRCMFEKIDYLSGCTNLSTLVVYSKQTSFPVINVISEIMGQHAVTFLSSTLYSGTDGVSEMDDVYSKPSQQNFIYEYDDITRTAIIKGISGTVSENYVYLPESVVKGSVVYTVTEIGNNAFLRQNFTHVIIPSTIKTIGDMAFAESDLTSVVFESGSRCERIKANAFKDSLITSIAIPSSVTTIGNAAFENCAELTKVTFFANSKLTSVGINAFSNTSLLEEVIFTGPLTYVGASAFSNSGVKKVEFGSLASFTTVSSYLFNATHNLTSVTLPETVITIEEGAFINYGGTEFTFPSNLLSIGKKAFYQSKIESAEFPNGLTYIGEESFCENVNLTVVSLPDSVVSVGKKAFYGCGNVESVTLGKNINTIGDSAFYGMTTLHSIYYNVSSLEDLSEANNVFYNAGTSLGGGIAVTFGEDVKSIPDHLFYSDSVSGHAKITSAVFTGTPSVEHIGKNAFRGCSALTSFILPATVLSIDSKAFFDCTVLSLYTESNAEGAMWSYDYKPSDVPLSIGYNNVTSGGFSYVVYEKGVYLTGCTVADKIVVPERLNNKPVIGTGITFERKTLIKYIDLPSSILLPGSFYGCNMLVGISLKRGVKAIAENAFYGCSSLLYFALPDTIESIGENAFSGCLSLSFVYIDSQEILDTLLPQVLVDPSDPGVTTTVYPLLNQADGGLFAHADIIYADRSLTSDNVFSDQLRYSDSETRKYTKVLSDKDGYAVYSTLYWKSASGSAPYLYLLNDWTPDSDFTEMALRYNLFVDGVGEMRNYGSKELVPWRNYASKITSITIGRNITSIGNYSFFEMNNLKTVYFNAQECLDGIESGKYFSTAKYTGKQMWCSEKAITVLQTEGLEVEYCDCNTFGVVLRNNGDTSELSNHSDAEMKDSTIEAFDAISRFFASFTNNFVIGDAVVSVKPLTGSNAHTAYSQFYDKAKTLFDSSENSITKNLEYDVNSGAVIGINRPFIATFGSQTISYDELKKMLAGLFGYADVATMTDYFSDVADLYKNNMAVNTADLRFRFDGAVYTANGMFVLPFAMKNSSATVLLYVFTDSSGNVFIWVSDLDAVKNVSNFENVQGLSEGEKARVEVFGRCMLFETQHFTVRFGSFVTRVPAYLFYKNEYLQKIEWEANTVLAIGKSAFEGCKNILEVVVPDSVTNVGERAYFGCSGVTLLTIGQSVRSFGSQAFGNFGADTSKFNLTTIRYNAISATNALSDVFSCEYKLGTDDIGFTLIVSKDVISMPDYLFYDCDRLVEVSFLGQSSLRTIGQFSFYGCSNLRSIAIPFSVVSLGKSAFAGSSKLESIAFAENTKISFIGEKAFNNTAYYNFTSNWTNNVLYINGKKILLEARSSIGEEYSVLDGADIIAEKAFANNVGLKYISIPPSVDIINNEAFTGCVNLKTVFLASATIIEELATFDTHGEICRYATVIYCRSDLMKNNRTKAGDHIKDNYRLTETDTMRNTVQYYSYTNLTWECGDGTNNVGVYAYLLNDFTTVDYYRMVIAGDGVMQNYTDYDVAPWYDVNGIDYSKLITKLSFERNIVSVGNYAFARFTLLKEVEYKNANVLTTIGKYAFSGCTSLEAIEIEKAVTTIGKNAFSDCTQVGVIRFKAQYCSDFGVENGVFQNVGKRGEGVTLEVSTDVLQIPDYFCDPTGQATSAPYLTSVKFLNAAGNLCRKIGKYAFAYCSSLQTLVCDGNELATISEYAFYDCVSLQSLSLPVGVTKIEDYAFKNCTGVSQLILKAKECTVKEDVFENMGSASSDGLSVEIADTVVTIPNMFLYKVSAVKSVSFPVGEKSRCETIGGLAFAGCSRITTLSLPYSLATIGRGAFYGCTSLTSYSAPFVGGRSKALAASESTLFGYVFHADIEGDHSGMTLTQQSCGQSENYSFYIPNSIKEVTVNYYTNLYYGAFENCTNIVRVVVTATPVGRIVSENEQTIVNNGSIIGSKAFYGCSALQVYTVQDTLKEIGEEAFYGCTSMIRVTVPENVASIGKRAFANCGKVSEVFYYAKNCGDFSSGDNVFMGLGETKVTLTIGSKVIKLPDYFFGCVLASGEKAPALTDIVYSGSETELQIVGKNAFFNCEKLNDIVLPAGLTSIGQNVFTNTGYYNTQSRWTNCALYYRQASFTYLLEFDGSRSKLTTIECSVEANTKLIADAAFRNCDKLTSVVFPSTLRYIGAQAFQNCKNLTVVNFVENNIDKSTSIEIIGEYAFDNCAKLTTFAVKKSVKSIGAYAFYSDDKLEMITIDSEEICSTITAEDSSGHLCCYAQNILVLGTIATDKIGTYIKSRYSLKQESDYKQYERKKQGE